MAILPVSSRDLIPFRPNSAAVKAAREALDKAQEAVNTALTSEDGGPDAVTDDMRKAVDDAQKRLDAAEEARAKADPEFMLKVPTGRSVALVDFDVQSDPDAPKRYPLKDCIDQIMAEAEEAGADETALAAITKAKTLMDEGKSVSGDDWKAFQDIATETPTGRRLIASYVLVSELEARHRIRRHLVLDRARSVLAEKELEAPTVKPHLAAINAELVRLSTVTEDEAKNSDAP